MVLKLLHVQSKVSTIEGKATKAGMETIQPWLDLTKHRHLRNQPWLDLSNHRHIQNQPFQIATKQKEAPITDSVKNEAKKWSDELNSKRFFIKKWKLQEEYKTYFYEKKLLHGTDFPTMYLLF